MKKGIHPKLNMQASITDLSSGQTFVIPSTKDKIVVEVTNLTHPFYTGKYRIVDTENLVKKFEERTKAVDKKKLEKKREKRQSRRKKTTSMDSGKTVTLKDMLSGIK